MLNTPFAKTLMLVAVAAVITAAFLYRAAAPRFGIPDEKLRLRHPAGFSAVQPRDWIVTEIPLLADDLTKPHDLGFFENRSEIIPAEIMIRRLPTGPLDLDPGLPSEQIAGRLTYRKVEERRKFVRSILWFEDAGVWYRVTLRVPHGASDADLYPYVATLRTDTPTAGPTTSPTTHPNAR